MPSWGDTRHIAEPTYKTFNLLMRLSTYLQDFQLTYKTFDLPTSIRLPMYIHDFQLTYKAFNLRTRHTYDRQLDFEPFDPTYKTLNQRTRLSTNLQDSGPIIQAEVHHNC